MNIKSEIIEDIKKEIRTVCPRMNDEDIERYIQAFLKEESTIKQITNFVCYCKAHRKKI